jgi:hypothetical protein
MDSMSSAGLSCGDFLQSVDDVGGGAYGPSAVAQAHDEMRSA